MEGENQKITHNQPNKIPTNDPNIQPEDNEDSSEWSLASLEELKSMNIKDIEQEDQHHQYIPKEKQPIQVKFPDKPTVLASAPLHQVGKIIFVVGELLIIQSKKGPFVIDLDNWLCDQQRNLIGFVIDVLGKVQNPFYAIKPQINTNLNNFIGSFIYYIEGSSKILRDEDIQSMKSKSALEAEQMLDDDSSDSENIKIERDFSGEKHEKKQVRRHNKFKEHDNRQQVRDRTRQFNRNNRSMSRGRNDHNQKYLESMYSMHFNQMMRLYNGNFQPNSQPQQPQQLPIMENLFANQQMVPNSMQHANIAQFGSTNMPNQFYGQVFQPPSNQNQTEYFGFQQLNQQGQQTHPQNQQTQRPFQNNPNRNFYNGQQ